MQRWGHLIARRRWAVLVVGLVTTAVAGAWGLGVFGALSAGGFDDPGSESARAEARIVDVFGPTEADLLVLYESDEGLPADDLSVRRAVTGVVDGLPADDVLSAPTAWTGGGPQLVAADGASTLVPVTLAGADDDAKADAYDRIRDDLDAPGLRTEVGGPVAVFSDVSEQVAEDIGRAEGITMPLVVLLSLIVFGSVVGAFLPALVGGIAIVGSFTLLRVFTTVTDVSVFAINVITLLGVGLAIDYALFVVSRFREELAAGRSTPDAVAATMATAGRTVAFSGLTVAVSLASLLLFPQVFLRSMGFGGMAAVLVAMVAALTVLPALLAVLGPRVDAGRMPWRRRPRLHAADSGTWARIARGVMRRPVVVLVTVVVGLVALGLPFLRVEWTGVDERVLPAGTESRVVSERLASGFADQQGAQAQVVVTGADPAGVAAYSDALAAVDDVESVRTVGQRDGATLLEVTYPGEANSSHGRTVVEDLRDVPAPEGAEALVGGPSAQLVDLLGSLADTLPWMGLVVVVAMLVLLFLAFGSVLLPVKAVLVNVISVVASFGVVVWVFQDGHLADLLSFTPLGALDATQPILMLAILFGLSMDYEVFLLSRVREQWDRTGDNTQAVAVGLQRTGGIITSAALLLAVVIGAFATSGITFIKMIGVGMLVAILVDATVVRTLLVPGAMRLMGRANWWAPGPLARWWQRHGFREQPGDPRVAESPPPRILAR
jgi:trehalose monomycolate/heme transporter